MPVAVHCPRCNRTVSISERAAGKRVKCPHCQQSFLAPGVTAAADDNDDWLQLDELPRPKNPPPIPVPTDPAVPVPRPTDDSFFDDLPDDLGDALGELGSQDESRPPPRPKPVPYSSPAAEPAATPPTARDAKPPEAAAVEYASEFRVKCKVCDSITYANAAQSGTTISCSDCHSPMTVPPPPKIRRAPVMNIDTAATFGLGTPISDRRRDDDPMRKSAQELLAEAEREETDSTYYVHPDTPDVGKWFREVFGIFRDLSVVTHWIGLSITAAVPAVIMSAIELPLLYYVILPIGVVFGAAVVSDGFALLQSVANDQQRVSSWPILDPASWFGDLLLALAAAAVVAVPLAVVSHLLHWGVLGVAITMLAVYALFPFVLLSMMDMNSIWQPISAEVARSVTKCRDEWGSFYLTSGIMFAALFLTFVVAKLSGWGPLVVASVVFAAVGATFVYFAMIGRLAYQIGQAVNPPRPQDDDKNSVIDQDVE